MQQIFEFDSSASQGCIYLVSKFLSYMQGVFDYVSKTCLAAMGTRSLPALRPRPIREVFLKSRWSMSAVYVDSKCSPYENVDMYLVLREIRAFGPLPPSGSLDICSTQVFYFHLLMFHPSSNLLII